MTRPNILLITIDSLRADFTYGGRASTPVMDEMTERGTTFEQAHVQAPFTTFSMPSLFTSRYPSGLSYIEFSEKTIGVAIDQPTLTERLRDAGYLTAGFHSNPLLSNLFGFDKGFDTFDANLPFANTDWLPGRAKIIADKAARFVRTYPYIPAEELNSRALSWLERHAGTGRPFFLWLHYMDVHGPYQAKIGNRFLNKYRAERLWRKAVSSPTEITNDEHEELISLYQTEVEYVDGALGGLIRELRGLGLLEETLVTITADHGEQFGEHGAYSHPHQLYDELTHVPLILDGPGWESGNVSELVPVLDVAPTLATAGDAELTSFIGTPLDEPDGRDEVIVSEADLSPTYTASIRTPDWRYVFRGETAAEELYIIEADPAQQQDVASKHPDTIEQMSNRLSEHVSGSDRVIGEETEATVIELSDQQTEERLRDLGYLE